MRPHLPAVDSLDALTHGLAGTDLQAVLAEVMYRRAVARRPADLVRQHREDPFCAPAAVDQRTWNTIEAHLLAAAEPFEAIELSPLSPLGSCSKVAVSDQRRVVSALRATEVVADPTNTLALECAARLGERPDPVHLATSHRVTRAQQVPKLPGYAQHFRMFAMGSGGQKQKDHAFTVETAALHVRTLLAALDRLEAHGFAFGARRVVLLATPERAALAQRIAAEIGGPVEHEPLTHIYYSGGIRWQVWVTAPDGAPVPLADGGTFDWLAQLTANARLVFVASGLGAQLVPVLFRASP